MRGRWGAAAVLCLTACTELTQIDFSERPDALLFLVTADDLFTPLRTSEPLGLQEGRVIFGARPQLELREEERLALLVDVPLQAFFERFPGFSEELEAGLSLQLGTPPQTPQRVVAQDLSLSIQSVLPSETRFERLALEPGPRSGFPVPQAQVQALTANLRLSVEVEPEHCKPALGPLTPFGAASNILGALGELQNNERDIEDAVSVDPAGSTLLLLASGALYVARRGALVQPSDKLSSAALFPGAVGELERVAIDRRRTPKGHQRVIAVGHATDATTVPPRVMSYAFELRLSAQGKLEYVSTATIAEGFEFKDVDIDASGRTAIIGDGGNLLLLDPGGSVRRVSIPNVDPSDVARRVLWLSGGFSLLASTRNQLNLWNERADLWINERFFQQTSENAHFFGLADHDLHFWGGGSGGIFARYTNSPVPSWETPTPLPPPRFLKCGKPDFLENPQLGSSILSISISPGYLHLAIDDCNALVHVRTRDLCTSLTTPTGESPQVTSESYRQVLSVAGSVIVAGEQGRVLISAPE